MKQMYLLLYIQNIFNIIVTFHHFIITISIKSSYNYLDTEMQATYLVRRLVYSISILASGSAEEGLSVPIIRVALVAERYPEVNVGGEEDRFPVREAVALAIDNNPENEFTPCFKGTSTSPGVHCGSV